MAVPRYEDLTPEDIAESRERPESNYDADDDVKPEEADVQDNLSRLTSGW